MTIEERNALVEQYVPLVRKITHSMIARGVPMFVDVEDVTQDVIVKLLAEIEHFRSRNGASLTTYLYMTIRHDVLDSIRKHMRQTGEQFSLPVIDKRPLPAPALDRSLWKRTLTAKQLQAVELVYVYGFTQEKAARKMAISHQAIARLLGRSVSRLKESYTQRLQNTPPQTVNVMGEG